MWSGLTLVLNWCMHVLRLTLVLKWCMHVLVLYCQFEHCFNCDFNCEHLHNCAIIHYHFV